MAYKKLNSNKKQHRKTMIRFCTYTCLSFSLFQVSGIFSLATNSFTEVTTEERVNAFSPKTYVNVEIEEPNGQEYTLEENGDTKAPNGGSKVVKFSNPDRNTKYELVRVRLVAMVYDREGNLLGEIVNYRLTQQEGNDWIKDPESGSDNSAQIYYYKYPLKPGAETSNLFDSLSITNPEIVPEGGYIDFDVVVDTVETDQNASTEKAVKAWGNNLPKFTKKTN